MNDIVYICKYYTIQFEITRTIHGHKIIYINNCTAFAEFDGKFDLMLKYLQTSLLQELLSYLSSFNTI